MVKLITLPLLSLPLLLCAGPLAAQTITPIGKIQGTGPTATGGTYTIEGIVTGVYGNLKPGGFYVQNEGVGADGDPATSDALFVVQTSPLVSIGDRVRVSGEVLEGEASPSSGQAVLLNPVLTVLAEQQWVPEFTEISTATYSAARAEAYEGMRVRFSGPLTVSDVYGLKGRGELGLSTTGVVYQATQFIDPNDDPPTGTSTSGNDNVAAVRAYQAAADDKTLVLDDGSAESNPRPTPYLDPVLRTVRVGSKVSGLRGVLGYGYGKWRVQPLPGPNAPRVQATRPELPVFGPLDVKLASFNVLNYFNGDGAGGGFPTARGAKTAADFARQRAKLILALRLLNADIVGLTEIENDGTGPASALADLVRGLNEAAGAGTYVFVDDGGAEQQAHNTDVIHNAIIYQPARVRPVGPPLLAAAPAVFERPPLAQVFALSRRGRTDTLAFIVNHFKSKFSESGPDADQNDGQGGSNPRRREQARALVQFIRQRVVPAGATRVVSVGDYNANYEEDPLDVLRAAGLVPATPPISASYVFKGFTGSLDHAVVTPNLMGFIDVQKWAINSAEPASLQYDAAGEATDTNSPFRCSDHDPVLVGINFAGIAKARAPRAATRLSMYPRPEAQPVPFSLAAVPASAGALTLDFNLPQGPRLLSLHGPPALLQGQLKTYTAHLAPGIYLLKLRGKGFRQDLRLMKE